MTLIYNLKLLIYQESLVLLVKDIIFQFTNTQHTFIAFTINDLMLDLFVLSNDNHQMIEI